MHDDDTDDEVIQTCDLCGEELGDDFDTDECMAGVFYCSNCVSGE